MREEQVFIPWLGPTSNKIWAGVHWTKRRQIASEGHTACLVARGIKPFPNPVTLSFAPRSRSRLLDCANYWCTGKIIEDSLVRMGILKDDNPTYVKGFYIEEPKKGEPGILLTIREVATD